jgi:hypothetical protein
LIGCYKRKIMPGNQKDTIYVDIDDEITAIIDKVTASKERIVALVLPKRATVLQSIVNMKLLKRTADAAKKHVVLITSEAGLSPLAGAVGLHVAPTLQSRPVIPPAPAGLASVSEVDESHDFDPDAEAAKPVGELAGPAAVMKDDMETIELDNEEPTPDTARAVAGTALGGAATASKVKKNNRLKIPDFNKFKMGMILGGAALVALLVFGYFALFVMPKATITIATDSSDIPTNASITLDPTVREADLEEMVLPAKIEQKQQTGSQQVAASGQKNKGTKASGEVKIINCSGGEDLTIPAGTGVSSGGLTYVTQEEVTIPLESKTCKDTALTAETVEVISINPGAQYNIGPQSSFSVAGQGSSVKASSSEAMTGGTDRIVKVVAQSDIDSAKQKISSQDSSSVKNELKGRLEAADYFAITSSLQAGEPVVTPNVSVGDEADTVTVTSATTYTMYGVKKSDVEAIIRENVEDKIDASKQKILELGLNDATFDISSPASRGPLQVTLAATTLAGPDIKIEALKKQIAGKKTNDVRTTAKATPGVSDVSVKYSPFWVSKVPKNEAKITVVIEKTPATSNED